MDQETLIKKALEECAKEPIHILGRIQTHGILVAFNKTTKQLSFASENAFSFFEFDKNKLQDVYINSVFDMRIINFFDFLTKQEFYNKLFTDEIEIKGINYLVFFSNAQDHIIIELEKSEGSNSKLSYFTEYQKINQLIDHTNSKRELFSTVLPFLKDFTGYDRVMIYQFDEKGDGEIIAEEKSFGLKSFLGLKYPASDIPEQARKLYMTMVSRSINDVADEGFSIVNTNTMNNESTLNLSYSVFRSVSPTHLEYLTNMGVKSTHAVSIIIDDKLWGMLIFHHYESPKYLNFNQRFILELIVSNLNNCIKIEELKEVRTFEQQQGNSISKIYFTEESKDLNAILLDHWLEISKYMGVSGYTIIDLGVVKNNFGTCPLKENIDQIGALLLKNHASDRKFSCDEITTLVDQWNDPKIAGFYKMTISQSSQRYVVFWREEKQQLVHWAGNPEKSMSITQSKERIFLTPRKSFEIWTNKEKGKSLPWKQHQLNFANELQEILISKEIKFYENILKKNSELTEVSSELQRLLEERTEELKSLNYQLEEELKSNIKYQKELEISIKAGQEINKVKSKVVANISHEVRTPIAGIIGLSELLEMSKNLDDDAKKFVKLIGESANRLLSTADKILLTSKLEAKNFSVDFKSIELNELTKKILNNLELIAAKKNQTIYYIPHETVIEATTDEDVYGQIINNLVSNAIKYSKENAEIEVNLKRKVINNEMFVNLTVEDNGMGIKKPENIFDPYYTEYGPTKQKDTSTGLGLYIVKTSVENLGGSISVESKLNVGSKFEVVLPLNY